MHMVGKSSRLCAEVLTDLQACWLKAVQAVGLLSTGMLCAVPTAVQAAMATETMSRRVCLCCVPLMA